MNKITDICRGCNSCPDDEELVRPLEKINFVEFSFDPSSNSLDIFFKRKSVQWDNGIGIQLNHLTKEDKEALKQYLENGT